MHCCDPWVASKDAKAVPLESIAGQLLDVVVDRRRRKRQPEHVQTPLATVVRVCLGRLTARAGHWCGVAEAVDPRAS